MTSPAGLAVLRRPVDEAWIDYNDHMTEGAYGVVFADASDALLEHAGFTVEYRDSERGTFYTAETHVVFLAEIPATSTIEVGSVVVGVDEKRLHLLNTLVDASRSVHAATQESMLLHVSLDSGRVVPMATTLRQAFEQLRDDYTGVEPSAELGRGIKRLTGS